VRVWQVAGIAVAIFGLGAFLVFNERGERSRRRAATAANQNLVYRSRIA
jgi:hypothetical protein